MYDPQLVDEMLNSKQKDVIVEFLRKFEPKTVDVRITLDRIIAVDIGLDSFLPVNHLGGGPGRMLTILSGLYGTRTGILIIDEVENGFHVSSITELWRMILEHSRITNTQVFVTTHSRDVLEGLNDVLVGEQDSVACYWLSKLDSDQIKAYRYSPLELAGALDANIDIRH
ncbi:MAG: ATP-binding protein [Gemmatimonadetes bacterium]|nr:ATP-binding protein [Gemmatimonadota bacterium]